MKNKKYFFLYFIFIVIKITITLYLFNLSQCNYKSSDLLSGILYSEGGDTFSYLDPFENLISENSYHFYNGKNNVYAGRMPQYGFIYYIFRHFFNKETSSNLQVLLQFILEVISSVILLHLVRKYFKNNITFLLSYVILLTSTYWSSYTLTLSPESIGISIMIFALYLYYSWKSNQNNRYLFLVGLCLTYITGLKPYMGILFVFIGLDIIFFSITNNISLQKFIKFCFLFSITYIVFTLTWSYRNYYTTSKPYILTEPYSGYQTYKKPISQSFRNFIGNLGEIEEAWNKKALSSFFYKKKESIYTIDDIPLSNLCNKDSILVIREIVSNMYKYEDKQDTLMANRIDVLAQSYIEDKPHSKITSRLKLIPKFLLHSGSFYLPISKSFNCYKSYQMPIKYYESLLYYFVLIFGFIGLFLFTIHTKDFILISIPLFLILLFCVVLRHIEWRYFLYSFISLFWGTTYFINICIKKINKIKL
ncbi:glycosyltransferase family 39 protein [Flammeovirga kamogawensis]|uniref:Glycosyltransferase family 39 protein n=1 Tax=Flammeovirga kamogawensis TaxID=373891 RepID=A0ABX8GX36_9BACT|nr:glycosyltransferase family 39 protein [Flammeovirga kamogawensis]MBB6460743.1 4-amino-4-deoxy-L-arabinose transferase-like glycosyltransferase [Flammeovirga kamogawensis]QWG08096.1 glycosyltransferase family 39 protein [Flammeovirga kamogawensis]TRX69899.1 hypothetical protein EO216_17870 [Flammeovirga kamogawensis]